VKVVGEPSTIDRQIAVTITVRTLLLAALVVFLGWAIVSIREALVIVFLGIFLGLVFEAPTRAMMSRTGLSRGLSATIVVLGAALAALVIGFLLLVPLVGSVRDFLQDLPDTVAELRERLPEAAADTDAAQNTEEGAQRIADAIPDAISAVLGLAGAAGAAALTAFTLIFVALFFISDAPRLRGALASVLPPDQSARTEDIWERITNTVSRWAIGAATIAVIAGTVQGGTAWLLGASSWLALGVIAAFLDLIPNIGATIAGFILCFVVVAEEGWAKGLIMLAVVLVYQQVENNLLTPTIQGKATNISGFFVITGVTLFGALLGVVGALIAVPVTASLQIVVQEYTRARRERYAALADEAASEGPVSEAAEGSPDGLGTTATPAPGTES
jgi:predicted PurR-regulated permease PerM